MPDTTAELTPSSCVGATPTREPAPTTGTLDPLAVPVNLYDWQEGRARACRYGGLKRVVDVAGALILGVVALPLCLVCAALVRLGSPGPVLFRQVRVGRGGRLFTMLKFRSMVDRAEAVTGPTWAQREDPRVTAIGRVMRRYRIDELPQLWNVFAGDMSLIGPRPERPELNARLHTALPRYEHRLLVKPGITGWAQVRHSYTDGIDSARTKLSYDLYYIAHLSPWFDVRIALETTRVMWSGFGAR